MNRDTSQKKTIKDTIEGFLFSYNIPEQELRKIEPRIIERNSSTLKTIAPICAVLFFVLVGISFFVDRLRDNLLLYLFAAVGTLVIVLYELFFVRMFPKLQSVVFYAFLTIMNVTAIALGTYASPDELALAYIVLILVQAAMFVNRPVRLLIFQLTSALLFSVAAIQFKEEKMIWRDLFNVWGVELLSFCISVYTVRRTSQNILTEYRLENLGIVDQLTGMRNRNCYENDLEKYPNRAKFSLACVFLDVNGLHALNDKEGHEAGDRMLQYMACGFQKAFGEKNTYRIGGDEFVAIPVDMGVDEIKEKISILNSTFEKRGYHAAIGYAFTGVARNRNNGVKILDLVKSAEENMYREKANYYRTAGLDERSQRDAVLALKEQSKTLAFIETDDLTGLYTKQAFCHHVQLLLRRNQEVQYNLIMLDIGNFKYVNERYGEETGDRILRKMGNQIKTDKEFGLLAGRFGSDVFVFLVEQGETSTEETISYFSKKLMKDMDIQKISLKYGLYENVEHAVPVNVLCDRAMMALRSIKRHYGTVIGRYDESLQQKADWENRLEESMEKALKTGQFQVYYQPKHDAKSGKLIGAEALIRWIHPEFGFISPGDFIPLFEKNGFVARADFYVWENVCRDLKVWKENGISTVPVSVNTSKLDFMEGDYWERIHRSVDTYKVPKEMLHIEVTETLVSGNIEEELVDLLNKLREEGFKIEMDDFGKGYSSLNILGTLPLDILKLDMSFIRNIGNERKFKVLASVISMAKNLQLQTVAEGVETKEQLEVLRDLGCDGIQGYYFSKPLPKEEFTEYLKNTAS